MEHFSEEQILSWFYMVWFIAMPQCLQQKNKYQNNNQDPDHRPFMPTDLQAPATWLAVFLLVSVISLVIVVPLSIYTNNGQKVCN